MTSDSDILKRWQLLSPYLDRQQICWAAAETLVIGPGGCQLLAAVDMSPSSASLGPRKTRLGATVCFSRLELTLHGSLVLSLAADVVVLPLHTRH